MKIICFLIFFLIASRANAEAEYFSSVIKNRPRVTAIVYKKQVVFQNLLNRRYVYTIPKNGEYVLENGQKINIKNGEIIKSDYLEYDTLFALGVSSGNFFNQTSKACNIAKFQIAKSMLAMDCGVNFHQYQILPILPDFIRMIIVSKDDILGKKSNCSPVFLDENELLEIEAKTDEAIIKERELNAQKEAGMASGGGSKLNSEQEKQLKKAEKEIKRLKPWEFGLNERETILNGISNQYPLKDEKIVFYLTYFNDIGCIPYNKIKLLSCSEYVKYKGLFFETYQGVSEFNEETDDKSDIIAEIADEDLILYDTSPVANWKYKISQCNLKEQKMKQ